MNPIKARIKDYLNSLPSELLPLKKIGSSYLKHCCFIDIDSVHIAHRPWLGSQNYAFTMFSPAKKTWIKRFGHRKIPKVYQEILMSTNGLFAFGLSLYGLPPSMQQSRQTLSRSTLQCLDLSTANKEWVREYEIDPNLFYFGGREYSFTENIGYFMNGESNIQAYLKTGELIQEWKRFSSFLGSELYAAEQMAKQETDEDLWD